VAEPATFGLNGRLEGELFGQVAVGDTSQFHADQEWFSRGSFKFPLGIEPQRRAIRDVFAQIDLVRIAFVQTGREGIPAFSIQVLGQDF